MNRVWRVCRLFLSLAALSPMNTALCATPDHPNIVFILADDLGYGDLSSYGAKDIRTPNMDRLAREGLRFVDAHSPHSVCTPTRYSLLTGRYAWRTWAGTKTIWADDPLLIETQRLTLPGLLKEAGYQTAIIGKWHLGFGAPGGPGWDDMKGPDWNGELKPGPLEVGFNYFFGIPHTGQQPNVFIENHRVVHLDPADPLEIHLDERWQKLKKSYVGRVGNAADHRFSGGRAAAYAHEDLARVLTQKAIGWIEQQRSDKPFFLYFAHRNPHAPIVPNHRFHGKSDIGPYGDFLAELDWSVGEILRALDSKGLASNTLVVLTSDNGGVSDYQPSKVAVIKGHRVNGPFFGQKTEAYEGGNRIPLLIRWPGVTRPSTVSDRLVALTDFVATFAELLGTELPFNAAEDSFSFLSALRNTAASQPVRDTLVMDSMGDESHMGYFAIRQGPWKLILGQGGGGTLEATLPRGPNEPGAQLFDLSRDPAEQLNVIADHSDIVTQLTWRLRDIQYSGRSRPYFPATSDRMR